MKAIVQDRYGSADVLEFRDIEEPLVGENDVLVRVHAAGCGPDVWHLMTGLPYMVRLMPGFRKMKVGGARLGRRRYASRRSARTVTGFRPGDEVMGIAERARSPSSPSPEATSSSPKPAERDVRAGGRRCRSPALTALQASATRGRCSPGSACWSSARPEASGTLAVQIAKAIGAKVTGVCSTSKVDLVRSIGADDVIDYTREDFADGARRGT